MYYLVFYGGEAALHRLGSALACSKSRLRPNLSAPLVTGTARVTHCRVMESVMSSVIFKLNFDDVGTCRKAVNRYALETNDQELIVFLASKKKG